MALPRIKAAISSASAPAKPKLRPGIRCNIVEDKDGPMVFLGVEDGESVFAVAGKKKQSSLIQASRRFALIKKALVTVGIYDLFRK